MGISISPLYLLFTKVERVCYYIRVEGKVLFMLFWESRMKEGGTVLFLFNSALTPTARASEEEIPTLKEIVCNSAFPLFYAFSSLAKENYLIFTSSHPICDRIAFYPTNLKRVSSYIYSWFSYDQKTFKYLYRTQSVCTRIQSDDWSRNDKINVIRSLQNVKRK